jgi:class 3 adenylate cyclase
MQHKDKLISTTRVAGVSNNSKYRELEKLAHVAEVMELLEESNKDKSWITEQIQQCHLKVSVTPTMSSVRILRCCPPDFISRLLKLLKFTQIDEFTDLPKLSSTYHWFFTDIVASSDPTVTTNEQAVKIIVLNRLIERTEVFRRRKLGSTLILPTGDGMAIGFSDSPEKPLLLAIELHKNLQRYNSNKRKKERLFIRIGLDSGSIYMIKDLNGQENVWGPGIIMARRVMDLARSMNIIASARIANDLRSLRPEYKNILHAAGDYSLKHGNKTLLYNVYGDGFGNKKTPSERKIEKSRVQEEVIKSVNMLFHNRAELKLEILDPLTMLTHHTILWDLTNISREPIERIMYYIDGDTPNAFPELNVKVRDEEDNELEMISLNVNKPYHKEFYVQLNKPLKPGQKGRVTQIEYDWQEPERFYFYRFPSNCKAFKYYFSAPKELDIKQKVLYADLETGEKRYVKTPPIIKYKSDRTEVNWESVNIKAHEAYRFDW